MMLRAAAKIRLSSAGSDQEMSMLITEWGGQPHFYSENRIVDMKMDVYIQFSGPSATDMPRALPPFWLK